MKSQNEWVRRYLYDVVRRLPENQRKDIQQELETLIEDMLEERMDNGKSEEENVQDVLRDLGDPAVLAAKYRGDKQCLLSGEYYTVYIQVLKIVLACVAGGLVVATLVSSIVQAGMAGLGNGDMEGVVNIMQNGAINIGTIPSAMIQAFGILTLIFVLLERNQVRLQDRVQGSKENPGWTLEKLPWVPEKKAMISKADSILGIIFTVLVSIMFVYIPELMGAWLKTDSGSVVAIPVFDMDMWNKVLPMLLISMGVGLITETVKLLKGRYCPVVLWTTIVDCIVTVIVAFKVLLRPGVWNENFVTDVEKITGTNVAELISDAQVWSMSNFGQALVALITFGCLVEFGVTLYHTLRFGMDKEV